jgi:hypothetical protein
MGYWNQAFRQSSERTWELVTGGTLPLMIGVAVFFLSTVLAHKIRGKESSVEWAWDGLFGLISTVIVGSTLFLFYLIFIYPAHIYHEDQSRERALYLKDSQIASISDKLSTSEDRATRLSDALAMGKVGVDPDKWPPLTEVQITEWATTLKPYNVKSIRVIWWPQTQAKQLFKSFQKVGVQIGCKVTSYINPSQMPCMEVVGNGNDPSVEPLRMLMGNDLKAPVGSLYRPNSELAHLGELDVWICDRPEPTPPSSTPDKSTPTP